jgi:two-component system nitrogen regulation sensor histidine kinase NtrY
MVFRNFRLNIIVRIVFLILAIFGFVLFIVDSEPIRAVYLGILILLLLLEFFYYADKLNRDLNQFFISILHDDFTSVFKERSRGRSFRELYGTLDEITLKFRLLRKEKEMRNQYLYSLIEQIKVGIISFEPDGMVHMVNKAFIEMLDLPSLKNGTNLKDLDPDLFSILESGAAIEKQLLKRRVGDEEKEFSITSAGFKMEDRFYNLISVQDIREELDKRELEAWQKLIRVLTHEIMNSVSPIASLTGSLHDLVISSQDADQANLKEKLGMGLEAIQERSEGLIKFTEAYQNLARIPSPTITEVKTKALTERIGILFKAQFETGRIRFSIDIDKAPESFKADIDLLEQVIINLIRNAVEAVEEKSDPEINLKIEARTDNKVLIGVKDNGKGIPADLLDRIFVPFFSTKEKGSGIGLSLSRQVVLMHGGSINVNSNSDKGSIFEIVL